MVELKSHVALPLVSFLEQKLASSCYVFGKFVHAVVPNDSVVGARFFVAAAVNMTCWA